MRGGVRRFGWGWGCCTSFSGLVWLCVRFGFLLVGPMKAAQPKMTMDEGNLAPRRILKIL